VRVSNRDAFQKKLAEQGIQTAVHYPIPPHHQAAYAKELGHLRLPLTEAIHREVVSLPISPLLSENHFTHIVNAVNEVK